MTAQELHLCLPVHQALVLVLDGGRALGALHLLPGPRRYAVLVPLRSVIHALLAVEPLPEGVLHGLPVIHDDYIGRRVNLLSVKPHLLFLLFLIVLPLRLQKHVISYCLVQVVALGREGRVVGGDTGGVVLQAVRGQLGVLVHVGGVMNLGQILGFNG